MTIVIDTPHRWALPLIATDAGMAVLREKLPAELPGVVFEIGDRFISVAREEDVRAVRDAVDRVWLADAGLD
jgi:hypothetical protein